MLKQDKSIADSLDALIYSIKQSDIYQQYVQQEQIVSQNPELKSRIDQFRQENYEMQQNLQGDELDRRLEEFEARYSSFRQNPIVDKYLAAELAFCRLIQWIETEMEEKLEN